MEVCDGVYTRRCRLTPGSALCLRIRFGTTQKAWDVRPMENIPWDGQHMSGADSGVSHGPETGEKLLARGDHAVRFFGNGTFTEMDLLGSA